MTEVNTCVFFSSADTKVELREDFDKLKMKFDNLTIETVFLRGSFQELTNQCKWEALSLLNKYQ